MNVLMVGVGPKRVGGMLTVAEEYIKDEEYNAAVNLIYISTSTNGSIAIRFIYMLIGYIKILFVLNFRPIDIVHIHMAEKGSTFRKGRVCLWAKRREKKVIIHLHAGPFMAWYSTISTKRQEKVRKYFAASDKVFVLGEHWKEELKRIISEDKMTVLYNGVSVPSSNPYNLSARNIVYFGVMKKEKGIYDLINVAAKIDHIIPDETKILLCGNDLEGDIQETIDKLGLGNRIKLMGWISGKEKNEVYASAAIDILPSYYEGLSMTVLEAMAYGIPVITTNISTMSEVLGSSDWLVLPGDINALAEKVTMLIQAPLVRKSISNSEFNRAKTIFTRELAIRRTLEEYKELLMG